MQFSQASQTPAAGVEALLPRKSPPKHLLCAIVFIQRQRPQKKKNGWDESVYMFHVRWVQATVYYHCYSLKNLLNLCRKAREETRTNQFLQLPDGILRAE